MKIIVTKIPDVLIIEPDVFEDARGFFFESFNQKKFNDALGKNITFVQDNQSCSKQGVLRGLHYQAEPMAQGKLVRAGSGCIFDVAVDIRPESPTFKQWVGVELSAENKKQLWIPEGFAHGFLTISPKADVLYKATNYWSKEYERTIIYNDNLINIVWPVKIECISEKDMLGQKLKEVNENVS